MPKDTRTGTTAIMGQRQTLTSTHHHTALLRANHIAAVVAIGALLWILGVAFVISWRHSGDRLRSILSEFDNHDSPPTEEGPETNTHTADPPDGRARRLDPP